MVCATMRARTRVLLAATVDVPPKNWVTLSFNTTAWSPPRPKAIYRLLFAFWISSSKVMPSQATPILKVGANLLPARISRTLSKMVNLSSIISSTAAWVKPMRQLSLFIRQIKPCWVVTHLVNSSLISPFRLAILVSLMPLVTSS